MERLKQFGVWLALLLMVMLAAPALTQAAAPDTAKAAADKAGAWLQTMQHDDGGYGATGPTSTLGQTEDAIFAFAALGKAPASISKGGKSLTAYLVAHIGETKGAAETCKAALAAATSLPGDGKYGGVDMAAKIDALYSAASGMYGSTAVDHIYCLLAEKQIGRSVPAAAITALTKLQISDGSWAFAGAGKPNDGDTNTTALAIQALVANGMSKDDPALTKAAANLKTQQNADGGFPYQNPSQYGTDTDANSTAYVVQGLLALGQDPNGAGWDKGNGATPVAALLKLQQPSGAFSFQAANASDNALATLQAIPALAYVTQPQSPLRSASAPAAPSKNPTLPPTGAADIWLLPSLVLLALLMLVGGLVVRQAGRDKSAPLPRLIRLFVFTHLLASGKQGAINLGPYRGSFVYSFLRIRWQPSPTSTQR